MLILNGKRVYAAINIYAWDETYNEIIEQAKILDEINVDEINVSDGVVLEVLKEAAPNTPIHISTQANITSYHTSNFWQKNGAQRVILARELDKEEIRSIKENTNLEVEMFIHGAICYSYSGRCHLSDFLASRSANLGDCAQSCRWAYNIYLEEKNKPGNLMPVEEDKNGTYILSSKDLCLIKELPEIIDMGIDSLKIEGRLKTEYYLATVISVYRNAIDDYIKNPEEYDYKKYLKELEKTKTRGLTTFYFNDKNNKDFQEYEGKQYNPDYEFGGKILEKDEDEKYIIEIRNRLQLGDILEILIPNKLEPKIFTIEKMWDVETNEEKDHVNPGKEGQKVILEIPFEVHEGWILRRKK